MSSAGRALAACDVIRRRRALPSAETISEVSDPYGRFYMGACGDAVETVNSALTASPEAQLLQVICNKVAGGPVVTPWWASYDAVFCSWEAANA